VIWSLALLLSCGGEPAEAPDEAVVVDALPVVELRLPEKEATSPLAIPSTSVLRGASNVLRKAVSEHGRDAENPWAISHAMLAFGPKVQLSTGGSAVDHVFANYAEVVDVGGEKAVRFPERRGDSLVEPHAELLLKAMTEMGVDPQHEVTVEGQPFKVADLYRGSLHRAWVDENTTSLGDWNNTPWSLQALATWGPEELAWTAADGHAMTLDDYTHAVSSRLVLENRPLRKSMSRNTRINKRGQGIFRYTCGGAHLMQGAAYAVGRGYGTPEDRELVVGEIPVLFWRFRQELVLVDDAIKSQPQYTSVLLIQRLKFLGHLLETLHKAAAMELFVATDQQKVDLGLMLEQLVVTIDAIHKLGLFDKMPELAKDESTRQMYLDLIGDSAHALRAITLATGEGTVRF